jgi:cytoskeletal protein RodZ
MNRFQSKFTLPILVCCLVLTLDFWSAVAIAQSSSQSNSQSNSTSASSSAAKTAAPASSSPTSSGQTSTSPASGATAGRTTGKPTDSEIAAAKASGKVWVNTETGVYHKSGRWYGKTKSGKFMTEAEAKAAGYKAAK